MKASNVGLGVAHRPRQLLEPGPLSVGHMAPLATRRRRGFPYEGSVDRRDPLARGGGTDLPW